MGVESQCMGLQNTNVVFLPLQISNVDSADKSRKEVSREKNKQEDVKGAYKCSSDACKRVSAEHVTSAAL